MNATVKINSRGFAAIEAILIVAIIVSVVGIGAYVLHQKKVANKLVGNQVSTSSSATTNPTQAGTTASIDKMSQQDAQSEAATDSSADTQAQQGGTTSDAAVGNVGGAYNENNL